MSAPGGQADVIRGKADIQTTPDSHACYIKFIWDIADTLNGAMAIPNLIGLIWLSRILFRETLAYTGGSSSEV